jgi:hypothetical protein
MIPVEATIEEFEQGAWIADLVSIEKFAGSFDLRGVTWTGTVVSEREEFSRFYTRVIGGKSKLATVLADKFYSGNVSLQAAIQDVCRESGESFGGAQAGVFLNKFERQRGAAYAALDSIANAVNSIWWIDRSGLVQMKSARDVGAAPKGQRVSSDVDSILLSEPDGLTLGSTYDGSTVRHLRWSLNAKRFVARLYFVPFIFRPPSDSRYASLESARVDRDNGDGTIDVIVGGRYGLTKIALYCGVPGSKVKVNGGEEVQVGYFAGDPQKPFAVSMAQNTAATKQVARNGDSVKVTITTAIVATLAPFFNSPAGPCVGLPVVPSVDVTGTITSGSDRLKVGD